jgi:hypothetical protein
MKEQLLDSNSGVRGIDTHSYPDNSSYLIEVEGRKLLLFHCVSCGREFAREPNQLEWRAAHVRPFPVKFLPDSNEQWVAEPCPGIPDTIAEGLPEVSLGAVFSEFQNEPSRLQAPPPSPAGRPSTKDGSTDPVEGNRAGDRTY